MSVPEIKQTVQGLSSGVDARFLKTFFDRMDDAYFLSFPAAEIATHIRMSSALGRNQRIQSRILDAEDGAFIITIVGFDYTSQFSVLCGLLSAFGLDIRQGDIFSFSKGSSSSAARIVDVFRVSPQTEEAFNQARQEEFQRELEILTNLLASQSIAEVRERLNRSLTERIERMALPMGTAFAPIELVFNDEASTEWTVLEVHGEDTFGILYAIANALSLRGIYFHTAKVRGEGGRIRDEFHIADSWGRAIKTAKNRQRLQWSVNMIACFTRFLPEAPDPATAMRHFDQLLERIGEITTFPDREVELLATPQGMSLLAHLLGSSDYLWNRFMGAGAREFLPLLEQLAQHNDSPDVSALPSRTELHDRLRTSLASIQDKPGDMSEPKAILNDFKDHQLLLIETRHAVEPEATSIEFSRALTDLAEVVVSQAAETCHENLVRKRSGPTVSGTFAIFALGKFGGREMGHASDLELLFVHDSPDNEFFEALARQTVDFIEAPDKSVFHSDLRLRPYGDAGPRSSPLTQFTSYYASEGGAAPFERQALIKLRWFGGNERLGRLVEAHRDTFTYGGSAWDWEDAMELRHRQMLELVRPGQVNVKYSAGGLIDIEYSVQYLQLLNGSEHLEIRTPTTLTALEGLRQYQIVREPDYWLLRNSYVFLRRLIDALRIVRGNASDLVLPKPDAEEFKSLARRLGYRGGDRSHDAAVLAQDIQETMQKVHEYFLNRFAAAPERYKRPAEQGVSTAENS